MATIMQPYNPWREQLAIGTLVPIISGILERQRERDENRKINAAIAKSIADAGGAGTVMPPMQSAGAGVPALIQGGNGWENAFHGNASNPLAQFDAAMGTAAPTAPQIAQPQQAQAMPVGANDIMRALFANLGTERFGMLNSEAMQKLIAPYLPIAEQARNEFRQKELADAVMNAPDAIKRLDNVWGGATQGLMPYSAITQAQGEIKPFETDTGENIQRGIFDYSTGQFRNDDTLAKSLTPEQNANLDMANRRLLEEIRQFNVSDAFRNKQLAQQNTQFEASRQDTNRPKYGAPFAVNGKLYQLDQNGETRPFMIGDEHADAPENFAPAEWTEADTQMIKRIDGDIADLKAEKQRLRELQDAEDDPHKKLDYNAQIKEIDKQIAENNGLAIKYIASKSARKSNSSIPKKFSDAYMQHKDIIDTNAQKFGVEPELIRAVIQAESAWNAQAVSEKGARGLMQLMPATAKGLGVANSFDPAENIRGGAELLGRLLKKYNGDIRKALWAYNAGEKRVAEGRMPDETKAYIPKVMAIYNALKAQSGSSSVMPPSTTQSQATPQTAPQATPKPQNTARNVSAAWTHPSKQAISNQQYQYMVKQTQEGKISWAHSQEELDRGLESIGYKRADTAPVFTPSVLGWRPQFGSNMPSGNTNSDKPATAQSEDVDVQEALKKLRQDDSVGDYFTKWNVLPAGLAGIRGKK